MLSSAQASKGQVDAALISDVRASSRQLVREFGFLSRTVAGTDLSPSAVHAIIEIGRSDRLSAKALAARLGLEKSTISRLLRSLIERGEVIEQASDADGRQKDLSLSAQGHATLRGIDVFAETQVRNALDTLDGGARSTVRSGLETYARALGRHREEDDRRAAVESDEGLALNTGYRPGLLAQVTNMQILYYATHYGFGAGFETEVAADMAEFGTRLDKPVNSIWRLEKDDRLLGSVSMDGESLVDRFGLGATQLRWFFVDPGLQGRGQGRRLLDAAMRFASEQDAREVHLWTFSDLKAARALYLDAGFVVEDDYETDRMGAPILMQHYVRRF